MNNCSAWRDKRKKAERVFFVDKIEADNKQTKEKTERYILDPALWFALMMNLDSPAESVWFANKETLDS